jgi:hypothetical protein
MKLCIEELVSYIVSCLDKSEMKQCIETGLKRPYEYLGRVKCPNFFFMHFHMDPWTSISMVFLTLKWTQILKPKF